MQSSERRSCIPPEKLIQLYCGTEQSFSCSSCVTDEVHPGWNMVLNKAEGTERQNDLKEEQIKSQQRIQEKQKKMQDLKHTVDIIKRRSQAAVDDSERIFTDLISSMEKKRSEVTELIRAQEKAELSRTERFLNQLEQEIADLQRRLTELEQLSHTHDHVHFLQSFPSLRVSPGCDDSPSFTLHQHLSFDGVKKPLKDLKKQAEKVSAAVQMILPAKLESREDYLQYFCSLTLDPNTTHPQLVLSEMNRAVTCSETEQRYSHHPDRFDSWEQVLCEESVCGRRYWEVEWSGETWVSISVSYKDIGRKGLGYECGFGRNTRSWSLQCSSASVAFWHDDVKTLVDGQAASRIGVYVDHGAGTLSFYSVSDTMELLHTVHTTFTQPLYAGVYIWRKNSTVRLCVPKEMMMQC